MSASDGVMFVTPESENNLVYMDYAILKEIDPEPLCPLYWGNDLQITLEKEFVIDLFLTLGIDFHPGHLRKFRYFPSKEITFVRENGCPGWFRMFEPVEEEEA